MTRFFFIFIFITITCTGSAQDSWVIDRSNSSIQFKVSHLTISSVHGRFDDFKAEIQPDREDSFEDANLNAVIRVESVNTGNKQRDGHLLQSDFLEADSFPEIKFQNASLNFGEDKNFTVTGDLTIKGITKKITFEGVFGGTAKMWGQDRSGFTASGTINRFDYDIKFNDVLDTGGLVVGEEVTFILNLEFIKQN